MARRKRLEAWAVVDADGVLWDRLSTTRERAEGYLMFGDKLVRLVPEDKAAAAVVRAAVKIAWGHVSETCVCDLCRAVERMKGRRK